MIPLHRGIHVAFYVAVAAAATWATVRYLYGAFVWPEKEEKEEEEERKHWVDGGFVVFYSSKGLSLAINAASGDPCTHIGIVFRMKSEDGEESPWLMIHADRPDSRVDLATGERHAGVQIVALDHYLATSGHPLHFYGPPPEGVTVPQGEDLARFVASTSSSMRDGGYEPSLLRLVAVAASSDPEKTLAPFPKRKMDDPHRPWFCSSFVAHVYQTWGWVNRAPPDSFHPKHFLNLLPRD